MSEKPQKSHLSRQVMGSESSPLHMLRCFLARWWIFPKLWTVMICLQSCLPASECASLSCSAVCVGEWLFIGLPTLWHHASQPMGKGRVRGRGSSLTLIFLQTNSSLPNNLCDDYCEFITSQLFKCLCALCGRVDVCFCVCVCHLNACEENQTFSQGQKIPKSKDIKTVFCLVSRLWSQRTKIPETQCKNILMLCIFTSVKTEV